MDVYYPRIDFRNYSESMENYYRLCELEIQEKLNKKLFQACFGKVEINYSNQFEFTAFAAYQYYALKAIIANPKLIKPFIGYLIKTEDVISRCNKILSELNIVLPEIKEFTSNKQISDKKFEPLKRYKKGKNITRSFRLTNSDRLVFKIVFDNRIIYVYQIIGHYDDPKQLDDISKALIQFCEARSIKVRNNYIEDLNDKYNFK